MRTLATLAVLAAICGLWLILWCCYVNPLWDRFCDWRIRQAQRRYERQLERLKEKRGRELASLKDAQSK